MSETLRGSPRPRQKSPRVRMEHVKRNDVDIGEREGPGDLHLLLASRNLTLQPFCLRPGHGCRSLSAPYAEPARRCSASRTMNAILSTWPRDTRAIRCCRDVSSSSGPSIGNTVAMGRGAVSAARDLHNRVFRQKQHKFDRRTLRDRIVSVGASSYRLLQGLGRIADRQRRCPADTIEKLELRSFCTAGKKFEL